MSFHYPQVGYAYILWGFVFLIYVWARWQRKRELLRLGDWSLIKGLIPIEALSRRRKKDVIALVATFLLIFTAMGPQFGSKLKEVKHRGIDLFIAMDTSRSMLAEDVAPSRLEKAKRSLGLLTRKLEGNRIGIIAFAGFAVIQCPLTVDAEAARMFLDILNSETVPKQGTAIGDAIRLALKAFPEDNKGEKAIVLLTDGEDHRSNPDEAAKLAKKAGVKIFTIGIGTTKGEVIKNRDDQGKVVEFHKYKGEMVLSRLDDGLLTKMATLTGGKYYRSSSTDKEIDDIVNILTGFEKSEFGTKTYQRYQERFQYFGFIVLLLLILEFFFGEKPGQWLRTKTALQKILPIFIIILLTFPMNAMANTKSLVIKGNKLLKKKDFLGAREQFESARIDDPDEAFLPYNIAATYFLEGNTQEAKRHYEQAALMTNNPVLKSNIHYNLGYISFIEGNREGAINKFKECLKINPNDEDAKYNIEYIRSGKSPPQPPQSGQQQGSDSESGDDQEKENQGDSGQSEQQTPEDQENQGELGKEDAERILQMIQDEEGDQLKNSKPLPLGSTEDENDKKSYEDW